MALRKSMDPIIPSDQVQYENLEQTQHVTSSLRAVETQASAATEGLEGLKQTTVLPSQSVAQLACWAAGWALVAFSVLGVVFPLFVSELSQALHFLLAIALIAAGTDFRKRSRLLHGTLAP